MVLFLAAITRGLFHSVLGADNAPFGPVMGKRGASGATGVGSSSSGATSVAASASATPSRWARAVSKGRGTLRQPVGCKAHEDGVLCSCSPKMDMPPQQAFAPHIARGYTTRQHSQPVIWKRIDRFLSEQSKDLFQHNQD